MRESRWSRPSAKGPAQREKYAQRAVEMLHRAIAKGFVKDFKDYQAMNGDDDLTALRDRDDFKKLLADLEKRFPPVKK